MKNFKIQTTLELHNQQQKDNLKIPKYMEIRQHILNNTWVRKEISREILRYFGLNENDNTTYQNLWDTEEVVFREKLTALGMYVLGNKTKILNA